MLGKISDFYLNDRLNKSLVIVFLLIFLLNFIFLVLDYINLIGDDFFLYQWLDVNSEYNPPAIFNGLLFLCVVFRCGVILKYLNLSFWEMWGWTIIMLVFLFLCFDEIFQIHENQPAFLNLNNVNWFKYYLIGLAFISIPCIPLFLKLPNNIKFLFILSAIMFIGGAVGLEYVANTFANLKMWKLYRIFTYIEEFMEMLGLLTFNATIVKYRHIQS